MTLIDKLGIGNDVISARSRGQTIRDISKNFNVSKGAVENFLKDKQTSRIIQKPIQKKTEKKLEIIKKSIFDISSKLEDLHKKLEDAEDFSDHPMYKIGWFKEYREQVKLAAGLIKDLQAYEDAKKFRQILVEEIGKESKDVQQRIINRIHSTSRPLAS